MTPSRLVRKGRHFRGDYCCLSEMSTPKRLHGTITQEAVIFIIAAVRTPILTKTVSVQYAEKWARDVNKRTVLSDDLNKVSDSCEKDN